MEEEANPANGQTIKPYADNTVEDGLIDIVSMGDAHVDAQFEGIGRDVPLHGHKFYEPGGYSQKDTKEHRHTMTTIGVEMVRPKVTGSIELIEDQLVYQRRTRN